MLGGVLSARTIAEVAAVPQDEFVTDVVKGVAPNRRKALASQASEIWSRANRIATLSER